MKVSGKREKRSARLDFWWRIELAQDRRTVIDAELHKIVRMTKEVPLKRIKKIIGKIRHGATAVSTGKNLWCQLKNTAGETANSLLEIFPSCKAGIPGLEDAAEGGCKWINNIRGVFHGRPWIYGMSRCIRRGCWRWLDTKKRCTETKNLAFGMTKEIAG